MSVGKLMLNYGTTIVFTQKNQPLLSLKRRFHFKTQKWPWNYNRTTATFNYVNDLMFNLSIYCNHFVNLE
jgi:hypothetical protein